jgi:hypothetical protein
MSSSMALIAFGDSLSQADVSSRDCTSSLLLHQLFEGHLSHVDFAGMFLSGILEFVNAGENIRSMQLGDVCGLRSKYYSCCSAL